MRKSLDVCRDDAGVGTLELEQYTIVDERSPRPSTGMGPVVTRGDFTT